MAHALSQLLNPDPAAGEKGHVIVQLDGNSQSATVADPDPQAFTPELFDPQATNPALSNSTAMEDVDMKMGRSPASYPAEPRAEQLGEEPNSVKVEEALRSVYPPLDHAGVNASIMDRVEETLRAQSPPRPESPELSSKPRKPGRPRLVDPDAPPKSSVHSSKNEGQHTDRRYLCYLCDKLFTRRRSVRDHISKIHNTKTWEPLRSLEVIVDPDTGEPIEPLEDVIARGPPAPSAKAAKKAERAATKEEAETGAAEGEPVEGKVDEERPNHPDVPKISEAVPLSPPSAVANLKKEPSVAESRSSSTEPFATPAPVAGRKRPAPDDSTGKAPSAAAKKKGTAKVKASNKRSKLNDADQSPSATRPAHRSPSATPVSTTQPRLNPSKLKMQTSASSVKSSPTPASSRAASLEAATPSSSAAETPSSSNDDGEVFCICRKGDNHTWMIACDGGCDEWFHGNCVNIRERDGELIDKYICPTCTRPGLQTTWKRMCRRKDCRKPARVMQDPPSKYCSDACGRMFFVDLVLRGDQTVHTSKDGQYVVDAPQPKKFRKKHGKLDHRSKPPQNLGNQELGNLPTVHSRPATPAYSEDEKTEYETDSSLDDDMLPNRASALRAGEVKALVDKCKNIEEWKALGRNPDTPPRELDDPNGQGLSLQFDDLESAKMASIDEEKRSLTQRGEMLSAQEVFLGLVKARSTNITDEVKKANPKFKDVCGFDPRMAWSDEEFLVWYTEKQGKDILAEGPGAKIGPPDSMNGATVPNGVYGVNASDGTGEDNEEADSAPKKGGICIKNRCPRHRSWAKAQLAELRFEQDLVRRSLARCETEANKIRERAMVRAWENRA